MARTGTVTPAKGLNLRATPGGTILKVLPKGTVVEILDTQNGTLKVDVSGQVGFVAAEFIQQDAAGAAGATGGTATANATAATGTFRFVGDKAVAPDGSVFGKKFKLGIFNNGNTSIADFVSKHQDAFTNISASRLRVMSAVSVNEGKLEAINTWDNAFVTFGCFQWTAGSENDPGELPAMVNRLKQTNPAVFQQLLGQFGLDIASVNSRPGVTPTGFFSLNGVPVKTAADKQAKLRNLEWAFRFFRAGHDDTMRQVEIEYAASRIDLFYRDGSHKVRDLFVADFVSSEFGVALLLDQHVNRPAHVPKTLAAAVNQFITSTGKINPATWTDQDEAKVLSIYLQLRRTTTNMTDSDARAERVRQAVNKGLASDKRGSFQP